MIKIKYTTLLLFFFTGLNAQITWQFDKDSLITWYYQDGDEFNGTSVNTQQWDDSFGWGRSIWGNKEQQYYSVYKNHFLKDGKLILSAKREDVTTRIIDWMSDNDSIKNGNKFDGLNKRNFTYTAGMIQSKVHFLYGYFEIKFKISKEKGFWPAFWLYGGSPNEEIDWMELKTEKQKQVHVAIHCQDPADEKVKTLLGKKTWGSWVDFKGSLGDGYNVISGIWTATGSRFYLNGECIGVSDVKMSVPKKLVANIAVAHDKGPFNPGPDPNFKDSTNFEIDYIRVWSRNTPLAQQKNIQQVNASAPIQVKRTSLKSKKRIHYGKKEQHKNEGFFVSLMPESGKKYQVTVMGKNIPEDSSLMIKDDLGKTIHETKLTFGINSFDVSSGQNIVVKAFGKEASYHIN